MKAKTSELSGAALDWAVAKCEGEQYEWESASKACRSKKNYSIDWSQGGPIIERERIETVHLHSPEEWMAHIQMFKDYISASGKTPLEAAMRCYVASKMGDEVEVPDELCKK
jgi:Protein of unknown function (DUF2591)